MAKIYFMFLVSVSFNILLYILFNDERIFTGKRILSTHSHKKPAITFGKTSKHPKISQMALDVAEKSKIIQREAEKIRQKDEIKVQILSQDIILTQSQLNQTKSEIKRFEQILTNIARKKSAATEQSRAISKAISSVGSDGSEHKALKKKLDEEISIWNQEQIAIHEELTKKRKGKNILEAKLSEFEEQKRAEQQLILALKGMGKAEKDDFGIEECEKYVGCQWNDELRLNDAVYHQMYVIKDPSDFLSLSLSIKSIHSQVESECNVVVELGVNEICDLGFKPKTGHRICRLTKKNCHLCHHQAFDLKTLAKSNDVNDTMKISKFCLILQKDSKGGQECKISAKIAFTETETNKQRPKQISCPQHPHHNHHHAVKKLKRRILEDRASNAWSLFVGYAPIVTSVLCLILGLLSLLILFK